MSTVKESMRQGLAEIQRLRDRETADPDLAARLAELRDWQGERLAATYMDLSAQPRFTAAITFFREDLYGGNDFSDRDRDFERIFPVMVRMLPGKVLATVNEVVNLHRVSERLDHAMCEYLNPHFTCEDYVRAWNEVGQREARARQIDDIGKVANALNRIVRKGVIRALLKVMHGPAHAAGLGAMQGFLERGFQAFRAMGNAQEFVQVIQARESMIMQNLFAESAQPFAPWITASELTARATLESLPQVRTVSR